MSAPKKNITKNPTGNPAPQMVLLPPLPPQRQGNPNQPRKSPDPDESETTPLFTPKIPLIPSQFQP